MFQDRVLSGMRPTGQMHLGHYHGALKNWVKLQNEFPCLFFAADWHALTTHFDETETVAESVWDMFVDWLAAGIDPTRATLFIQSRVPEHAELTLLLGMIAVCGIGIPSGCRNSATTANQSAIAPTIAASENAAT